LLKNKKSILLIMAITLVFSILAAGCGADKKASSSSVTDSSSTSRLSSDSDKPGTVKNGTVQMAPPKFDPPKDAGERKSADIKN
jgi:hypothetical protein